MLGLAHPIYSINQVSLRQTITPPRLLSCIHATWRFMLFGIGLLGSLPGGTLGGTIGLQLTLGVGGPCILSRLPACRSGSPS